MCVEVGKKGSGQLGCVPAAAGWLKDKFRPATQAPVVRLPLRLTTE